MRTRMLAALKRMVTGGEAPAGFALSQAVCRVAVGYALLHLLRMNCTTTDWDIYLQSFNPDLYQPVGILKLFGSHLPSPAFFACCWKVAYVSCWLVIVGALTRISFVLATGSMLLLTGLFWSFYYGWGHHQNVILLAAIAMMFGRPSPYSVDGLVAWLWRRWGPGRARPGDVLAAGLSRIRDSFGHRWPVLLGQFAVALMFANAAYWKLRQPGKPFGVWVWSDNFYDLILYQYWVLRTPMPAFLDWALSHEWAYKLLALGNLATQLTPALAVFLVNRPRLRAVAGLALLLETHMLGTVMHLYNPAWYLLYVFFIDWDRLVAWLGTKARILLRRAAPPPAPGLPPPATPGRLKRVARVAVCLWVLAFVTFYLEVACRHKVQRRYTFPFTAWPMYCEIMPPPPYSQHRPAPLFGSTWQVDAEPPLPAGALDRVWYSYYLLPWWTTWEAKTNTVAQVKLQLEQQYGVKVNRIKLLRTSFEILPYPAKRVEERRSVIACIYENNRFQGVDATAGFDRRLHKHYIEVEGHGFTSPQYRFGFYHNHVGELEMLAVERVGDRYYYTKEKPGTYSLCTLVTDPALGEHEVLFDGNVQP